MPEPGDSVPYADQREADGAAHGQVAPAGPGRVDPSFPGLASDGAGTHRAPDAPLKDLVQSLPDPQASQCEHREEQSSRLCASGTGWIKEYKVYAGRCVDWTTKTLWSEGKLVREETDDSACQK